MSVFPFSLSPISYVLRGCFREGLGIPPREWRNPGGPEINWAGDVRVLELSIPRILSVTFPLILTAFSLTKQGNYVLSGFAYGKGPIITLNILLSR